eukprot:g3278.t1
MLRAAKAPIYVAHRDGGYGVFASIYLPPSFELGILEAGGRALNLDRSTALSEHFTMKIGNLLQTGMHPIHFISPSSRNALHLINSSSKGFNSSPEKLDDTPRPNVKRETFPNATSARGLRFGMPEVSQTQLCRHEDANQAVSADVAARVEQQVNADASVREIQLIPSGRCNLNAGTVRNGSDLSLNTSFSAISVSRALLLPVNSEVNLYSCVSRAVVCRFDLFTINQHGTDNVPGAFWFVAFEANVARIGHTVLVQSQWTNPVPLTRAWCLWEILCTSRTKATFEIILPPKEEQSLLKALVTQEGFDSIAAMLATVDVANAKRGKRKTRRKYSRPLPRQEKESMVLTRSGAGFCYSHCGCFPLIISNERQSLGALNSRFLG